MKWRKRVEGALGTWGINVTQKIFRRLTPAKAERLGATLFKLIGRFVKSRQQRVIDNLRMAFPDWPEEKYEPVMWSNFEHFGYVMADFFGGDRRSLEELESIMTFEGREHIDEAFSHGKGVILLTGHFGNWELIASWFSRSGYKLSVVIRDADTEDVNDAINSMRKRPGTRLIPRGNAVKDILLRLRDNEMIGILPDQNSREIYIPFFGKPAGTVLGPGVIAERTGAVILFAYCVRTGVNQYFFHCDKAVEAIKGEGVKGEATMRYFNQRLEDVIRRYPEQYLWMHDRWRSARRKKLL
jgi:KDO2-lipid IV(A) lauroyltransferase